MASRQDKEWEIAMNNELDSLKQHQAFDKVPIKTALPNSRSSVLVSCSRRRSPNCTNSHYSHA